MNGLVEFLRARLDEDARAVEGLWTPPGGPSYQLVSMQGTTVMMRPARVLAEVEAKRQLVDLFGWSIAAAHVPDGSHDGRDPDEADTDEAVAAAAEAALRLLALPYADHPGYREEWKP